MSGASETRSGKPSVMTGFEETVKDFWVSRPRRPHAGRKVAGVAAGIGNRYGLDPVVVRVALVAATIFGGFGVPFYLLGWLFLPNDGDESSAAESLVGRGRSSVSPAFTIVLGILTVISVGGMFGGGWFGGNWYGGGGLLGFALVVSALYLLHRSRGQDNRPAPVVTSKQSMPPAGNGAFTMTDTAVAPEPVTPSGWDPLAADPSGWDLPEPPEPPKPAIPMPPQPRAPRHHSKVGGVTFSLAVLTAGAGVLANLEGVDWFTARHIVGLTLAVVGLGLVVGAFVRGGRGLIGLAIPLSIAGMVLTTVPFDNFRGGLGDLRPTPHTAAEVLPLYQHAAGDIDLDLSELPAGDPYTTTVHNGAGSTTITVPATADVTFDCKTDAGHASCLNRETDGVSQPAIFGTDNGTDGPGGQKITLHVENTLGDVEVRRA